MKKWKCVFKSMPGSDLMFGKAVMEKKLNSETHEQFEERTWQQKIHCEKDGRIFLQPFAPKNALVSAGSWLSMKIPGEGKKTFTDRFRKAVLVVDKLYLMNGKGPLTIDDVEPRPMFVPSDGRSGGSRRVMKIFPTISAWETETTLISLDNKITEEVLLEHLKACGEIIGFGPMRAQNGGINGRFTVEELSLA